MDNLPDPQQGTTLARVFRVVRRLTLLLILAYGVHLLIGWFSARSADIHPGAQLGMVAALLLAYALLLAIPFAPGIEIGLMLLAMEGAWIAPWIYLATHRPAGGLCGGRMGALCAPAPDIGRSAHAPRLPSAGPYPPA